MVITLILISTALLSLYLYYYSTLTPKNFPPGPKRFPIWGSYFQLLLENYKFPYKAIHNMAKRYKTNILGLYLGDFPTVIVCDMKTVKEVLTRPEFQGRIDAFIARYRSFGELLGILFTEGHFWLDQRRFMLRNLRDFGYGRRFNSLENEFLEDVKALIDFLNENKHEICKDGLALVPEIFYVIAATMVSRVYAGDCKSFEEAFKFADEMVKFIRVTDPTPGALNITPWMRYFAPGRTGFTVTKRATLYLQKYVQAFILEHKEKITDDTTNDFIDRYLLEIRKRMSTESDSPYSLKQLHVIGMDLLLTGTITISITLGFIILLLAKHQDIQENCQKEIEEIVGRNRLPTLSDRQKMPYIEATIRESMRYQTLLPLGLAHTAQADTTLGGYFIPKNTAVFASLYSIHRDETIWEKPDSFIPERFIDADGKLIKHDLSLPFSAGKRVCVGETFSRQNMFMILAGLLQNFNFNKPYDKDLPDLNENIPGITESPKPFWLKITPRK